MSSLFYQFEEFLFDVLGRSLRRNGEEIPLTGKEFDALLVLVEHSGEPVSKELLVERLWGKNTELEQSNLPKHISALRRKLGQTSQGQSYIRTLPGSGYYFGVAATAIAPPSSDAIPNPVKLQADESTAQPAGEKVLPVSPPRMHLKRRRTLFLVVATGVLCIAALLIRKAFHSSAPRTAPGRYSLAVLRFENQSRDKEADWLAVALPEMLRTELASGKNFHVISGEDVAQAESALSLPRADGLSKATLSRLQRTLDADFVILGSYSVLRSTQQLRLDVKIQDTRSGEFTDSESIRGSENSLFDLVAQCGITLRAKLGGPVLSPAEQAELRESLPSSLEATKLYTQGLAELRMFHPLKARDLLEEAVKADSHAAVIQSALAEAWATLGYENRAQGEAKAAFEKSKLLSRGNQLLLEARYRELSRDWPRAIEVYRSLWTFYPEDVEHGLRLVRAQVAASQGQGALRTLEQIRKMPSFVADPRIDLTEAQAYEALGSFSQELQAAERAIQKGRLRDTPLLVARAQLKACWALNYLGDRHRALEYAKTAQRTFARWGDKGSEAIAIKNIADVMDDSGDHHAALRVYQEALARFREIGSQTGTVVTLNNMGYAIKDSGDLEGAAAHFAESVNICRQINDAAREAQALNSLGGVYWRQGKLSLAEATFDGARRRFRETGDKVREAIAVGNLGLILKDEGQLTEAQSRLAESFELSRQVGNQTEMAGVSGNQGDLFLKRGELAEARSKYELQLAIGNRIREDKQRAYAFYGLGMVLLAQGTLDSAREQFQRSLDLRLQHHENGLAAESRFGLAQVEMARNNSAALGDAQGAADQFRWEREKDQEAKATALLLRVSLGQINRQSSGDQNLLNHLRELLPDLQDPASRVEALLAVAQYESAVGRRSDALKTARKALETAKEVGDFGEQLRAAFVAANLNPNASARLQALEEVKQEATAKGFGLIVSQVLQERSHSPAAWQPELRSNSH